MKMKSRRPDIVSKEKEIAEMYNSGKSALSISASLSCCNQIILKILNRNRVIKRKNGRKIVYKRNSNFFAVPNLLNSYWAGFIAADGCIRGNNLRIQLQESDSSHLEKIKNSISPEKKVVHTPKKFVFSNSRSISKSMNRDNGYYRFPCCYYSIDDGKIVSDLKRNFNITERKTFTMEFPNGLSWKNSLAFIVGFIDGDGSIPTNDRNYPEIHLVGTRNMMESVLEIFKKISPLLSVSVRQKGNIFDFDTKGSRIGLVLKELNKIDVPKMERKWAKLSA